MNDQKVLLQMISAILVLFFTAGCDVPAVSTPAPISQIPTIQSKITSHTPERSSRSLLIPVGRTAVVGSNTFQVLVDSEPYDLRTTFDDYGGYWIEVPYDPQDNSEVVLRFTVNSEQKVLYHEESENIKKWLIPSKLIDSDNPALIEEAERLILNSSMATEKARRIQEFVMGYLKFKAYHGHFLYSASDTYQMMYGTCVNFARLFVALSRAVNVPARTVWGVVYGEGAYDNHHEWAEFLDDDGYWHPLDLTYTTSFDLSDNRYLDLIYSSEENPLYDRSRSEQYSEDMTQFIVYDTTTQPYDGRLGFKLVEKNAPVSYVIENVFVLANIHDLVPQRVP